MDDGKTEQQQIEDERARAVEKIVEYLFTNSAGSQADRLVLIQEPDAGGYHDLGGWSRKSIADKLAELYDAGLAAARSWVEIKSGLPTDDEDYWVTLENGMGKPKVAQAFYDQDAERWWLSHKPSLAEADLDEWEVTAYQAIVRPEPFQPSTGETE